MVIRGPSAKGLDRVSGARVRIPLSPPSYYDDLIVAGGGFFHCLEIMPDTK